MRYFNNPDALIRLVLSMQDGLVATLTIFASTLLFSLPLGLLVALLRMNRHRAVSVPVSLYILVMRGTPLMLQIFAIYFAIPMWTGMNLDRMTATILAFSLNYAAYFAEIFRGGIQSIPVGQIEAGQVLGLTRGQTFLHVVMPQMIKRVLLPVSNEVITLVKEKRGEPHRVGGTAVCGGALLPADERRGHAVFQQDEPPPGVLQGIKGDAPCFRRLTSKSGLETMRCSRA